MRRSAQWGVTVTVAVLALTVAFPAWPPTAVQAATAPPVQDVTGDVDDYLRERMEATNTPGLAYAIVSPSAIEHVAAYGQDGDGEPVSAETSFLWGSVSKPVTANAVMTLVEQGLVDLDEPVRTYLPGFALADDGAAGRMTVQDLLVHTSGIPSGTGVTDRAEQSVDPYSDRIEDLREVAPIAAAGEQYRYSSENYLVLGAMIEAVTGQGFDVYLRQSLLDPLHMDGVVATPADAEAHLPAGHGYAFGRTVTLQGPDDPTGPSYGYLGGSVHDLATFVMAQLNGGAHAGGQILDPASVDLTQTGAVAVSETVEYGLGWRVDTRNSDRGTSTVWHSGAVPGYQTTLVLLPELDRGIVVLQNAYGIFQDWDLVAGGLQAARIPAGGEPEPIASNSSYPLVLGGLILALGGTVVGSLWANRSTVRGAGPRTGRLVVATTCWILGALAVAYLVGGLLPGLFGTSLPLIRLWAPDVGWLATAVVIGALVLAATRGVTAILRARLPDAPLSQSGSVDPGLRRDSRASSGGSATRAGPTDGVN